MNKRELKKYILDTFLFDVEKEKAVYTYLCKDKLSKKQSKLLTCDEMKFDDYHSWKLYFINKYKVYNKTSLLEFSKLLNLLLREARKTSSYFQNVGISYLSAAFSACITAYCSQSVKNIIALIVAMIIISVFLAILVVQVYNFYSGNNNICFYKDVKEIIDEIIEQKWYYTSHQNKTVAGIFLHLAHEHKFDIIIKIEHKFAEK